MLDVVQALRATAALNPSYRDFAHLMVTGANEIARLRAENDALTVALSRRDSTCEEQARRIAELEAALRGMVDQFGFDRVHHGMVHDERIAIQNAMAALSGREG